MAREDYHRLTARGPLKSFPLSMCNIYTGNFRIERRILFPNMDSLHGFKWMALCFWNRLWGIYGLATPDGTSWKSRRYRPLTNRTPQKFASQIAVNRDLAETKNTNSYPCDWSGFSKLFNCERTPALIGRVFRAKANGSSFPILGEQHSRSHCQVLTRRPYRRVSTDVSVHPNEAW
jgi:hypothetical protein